MSVGGEGTSACAGLARDKLLLLFDVGRNEVVKEEESLSIHCDKNVIFKVRDKTTVNMWHISIINTWWSLPLNVVGLQIHS